MEFLRELLAKFEVEVEGAGELQSVNQDMDEGESAAFDLSSAIKVAAAAFATFVASLGVGKLAEWISGATGAVDELGKLSTTLQISTTEIQQWNAFAETAGGTTSDVSAAMRRLSANMFEAQRTAGPAREAFERLGVAFEDSEGNLLPLQEVMLNTAAAIGGTDNNAQKLALAQETLGRGALKLIPNFKGTREEMQATMNQMGEMAGIFEEDFIRASEATNDELFFLKNQLEVLKSVLVQALLPAFRFTVDVLRTVIMNVREFAKETGVLDRILKVGTFAAFVGVLKLIALNWGTITTLLGRALAFIRPFIPMILKFAAWALILDDIIVFLQGGNSALGRFLDTAFGVGTAEKTQRAFADAWQQTQNIIKITGTEIANFFAAVAAGDSVWDAAVDAATGWAIAVSDSLSQVDGFLKSVLDTLSSIADTITGEALSGIADTLFGAEDERLNMEARARAAERGRAPGRAPRVPGASSSSSVDNSQVNVTLNGPQTPQTVRTATGEAGRLAASGRRSRSRQRTQNAVVRGN